MSRIFVVVEGQAEEAFDEKAGTKVSAFFVLGFL